MSFLKEEKQLKKCSLFDFNESGERVTLGFSTAKKGLYF